MVRERYSADPITAACLAAGSYTLSVGSMDPALVIERLLSALSVLSRSTHRRLVGPGGAFAAVPQTALRDGTSGWWDTEEASSFLDAVIGAINAAAPAGYACYCAGAERIELVRVDPAVNSPRLEIERSAPPQVSAIRARVR